MSKTSLALSVIMKDEEDHIDRFLESFDLSQFDEVVVVDTGSTDKSVEKFKAWGSKIKCLKIIETTWEQDFAKARQLGLEACTTEFVMWADLDDVMEGTEHLKQILKDNASTDVFVMKYNYSRDEKTNVITCELMRERIIRRKKFYWKGALHEVLICDEPYSSVWSSEVIYHHYPKNDETSTIERKTRNLKILEDALVKDPNEPRNYFYLGNAYMGLRDLEKAEKFYIEYVNRSDWDDEKYIALTRIAKILLEQGRVDDAGKALTRAMHMCPHLQMAYFLFGEYYGRQGEYAKALNFVELGLSKPTPKLTLAENPEDYDFVPHKMKFDFLCALGAWEEAYKWGTKIIGNAKRKKDIETLTVKLGAAEEMVNREKLISQFKSIRKYLLLNDESLKARELTNCIPYTLQYHAETKQMKVFDEKNFAPQIAGNIDAVGCDLPEEFIDDFHNINYKAAWLWVWLQEHPEVKTILDLGCNWGWFSFWLERQGYEVTGVDINTECLAEAKKRKKKYKSKVNFYNSLEEVADKTFDAVMAFDVIEHVEDDKGFVNMLMEKANSHVLLATPNGCFSRGSVQDAPDGETQPHLRAYVSKTLKKACAPWKVELMSTVQGSLLLMAAIAKKKVTGPSIAFYCGRTPDPWGPDSLRRGVGGSEEAVINVTNILTKKGYEVTVFNDTPFKIMNGVEWLSPTELEPDDKYDIMISWRNGSIFEYDSLFKSDKKFIWLHDVPSKEYVRKVATDKVDGIFVLSEYHKSCLPDYAQEKAIVTANGIDIEAIQQTKKVNNPHRLVWTSSYVRGLDMLLANWEKIRKEVPDAELDIMYGWETTDANPPFDNYGQWRAMMEEAFKMEGVHHHGRISQQETLEKMGECGVFAYLTLFPEISCISCMKAQAIGAVPFTTDTAALKETNKSGILVTPDFVEGKYKNLNEHIDQLIAFMKDEKKQKKLRVQGFKNSLSFKWENVVNVWDKLFRR